ncbi:MAG: LysR family transcriptional regulator, partial [Burkholderiales bacterium RIFCSPLOWO2_12_FULL_67_210]
VFQRVIDEGGFAAAGRALDISPAVVTRLVADLEEHLGTRLLHRTTRRLSLTEAGETYLERVRQILQDLDEAHALVSSHTNELAGVLRILAPPVLATHVLAPLVAGFRQAYPKIQLDIEVNNHREPPIEDYDVTLLGAPTSFDADVIARKIISGEAILVASPAYLARRPAPQTPAELVQHECLRIDVPAVLWTNHTDTQLRAALDGAGIAATTVELAAPHLANGALVRVLAPWIAGRYTLYAALPSRKFMPRRTRVFLDYLTVQTQLAVVNALAACEAC